MLNYHPGFEPEEYRSRTKRAQALMAIDGLDGLLLMTEPELYYFSGFNTLFWQSPTRPWFLFIPAEGKPIAVIPEIGAELMRRGWLDDVRTWPSLLKTMELVCLWSYFRRWQEIANVSE